LVCPSLTVGLSLDRLPLPRVGSVQVSQNLDQKPVIL
jgi:hypothetical protein